MQLLKMAPDSWPSFRGIHKLFITRMGHTIPYGSSQTLKYFDSQLIIPYQVAIM